MYERFYQLRERPFALSPDPDYLYPSRVHQEALDYLRYGLESQAGFIVITGEIGSGKTTLLQTLLRNVDSGTTVGRIVNTMLEPRELLETIMIDFGLDPGSRSKPLLLRDLSQYLVDQRVAGRNVLVVIDEAQNLGLGALEELRMLSNLETEKSKLMQIVLVGQPNLRDKLAAPELEQLRQRITVSYHLPPLDAGETGNYVNHRLRRAALGAPLEFPREATDLVHARSRGVPRIINVICDAALVFGYAEERHTFDAATIAEVLTELEATGVLPGPGRAGAAAPGPAEASAAVRAAAPPAAAPVPATPAAAPVPALALAAATPVFGTAAAAAAPAPAPAPAAEAMRARAAALDEREQQLRQREREVAEQRRVLAEEYRLMRTRAAAAAAPAGATRFVAASDLPRQGFWHRLKRIMLGVTPS
jgi:putative secretion ATPase (PEP-CTERM system associated)